ncbi:hypothetical protein NFI95_14850 [Acetobacteraceae bacterium KSS8]|uniref:Outer membrane protein assembly factor BamE n=1 Tax=Endosaccharibacter trunci TaxID=2812733 RepID=A0ABT1WC68_9PROT|nr:hypothetical protein [Acetobacteraceae bacterium KSS8]
MSSIIAHPALRLAKASLPLLFALGACSVNDSRIADNAKARLMGLSEVELESCLGVPDQHATFGSTDVLTYYATSSSSMSYSIPVVGGLGFSNGGYCHATFRVDNGRVMRVIYSGEKNATLAPDAYCTPILRSCMTYLSAHPEAHDVPANSADATKTNNSIRAVPPGAASAAPQPQASVAAAPSNVPTPTPR